jgi:hypothetical protein
LPGCIAVLKAVAKHAVITVGVLQALHALIVRLAAQACATRSGSGLANSVGVAEFVPVAKLAVGAVTVGQAIDALVVAFAAHRIRTRRGAAYA